MSNSNPLESLFRKPKFQLQLPSYGNWYPAGAIEPSCAGLVDVFSMTANDEARFKASEASLTGQGTIDLIKSCIPQIKQPEFIPAVDLDPILLAIRKASYGDEMQYTALTPVKKNKKIITVSIGHLLSDLNNFSEWDADLNINNTSGQVITFRIKPNTLKSIFDNSRTAFKQARLAYQLAENDLIDDSKVKDIDDAIKNLSLVQINLIRDSIEKISFEGAEITAPKEIENALFNLDVEYFKAITNYVVELRQKFGFKPVTVVSTPEEIAQGEPESYDIEVSFSQSDFFNNADQPQ